MEVRDDGKECFETSDDGKDCFEGYFWDGLIPCKHF